MNTLFTGHNFIDLPQAGSTNSVAHDLLSSHPAEGTVIRARHQTGGRGQKGAQWHAEPGQNLTLSVIYYPTFLPANRAFDLSRMASLALWHCLRSALPEASVAIKWPNDLLVNGRKIAGILIENQVSGPFLSSAIIGIGLNVNQELFPESQYKKATSLRVITGHEWEADEVMHSLLQQLEGQYLGLRSQRIAALESAYLSHLLGYQETIAVRIGAEVQQRHLVGVDVQGRLALAREGQLDYYDIKEAEVII